MRLYWHKTNNFGDAISPVIVEHFTGERVEFAEMEEQGKMVSTGSIIYAVRERDLVWGTGLIADSDKFKQPREGAHYAAVRGPLTAEKCGIKCDVYGDPGLLLPLIYRPTIEIKHKVGILPHYADKEFVDADPSIEGYRIDILQPWKKVVDDILSCELVVSSSLHGIIAAEAYGVPVLWAQWTQNVIGGSFKFQDYFLGTGRIEQRPFGPIDPIPDIEVIQRRLLNALPWKK